MSVSVVVGGQFGSEAKAKTIICHANQIRNGAPQAGIRCGGPNAGHQVYIGDRKYTLRLVPSMVMIPDAKLVICAGALVDPELLIREIDDLESMGVSVKNRLIVDGQAAIVDKSFIQMEKDKGLGTMVGSTQTGTGSTTAKRALREVNTVGQLRNLLPGITVTDTFNEIHHMIRGDWQVIVEGTQGFGLSMMHSGFYPMTTSKDTTAASFISEAGISPFDVTDILMVIRTYPIRVGGNSGPIKNEITWKEVRRRCGAPDDVDLTEMTSVTKKVRRVGEFDMEMFLRAVEANKPTGIAIHGLDYINWEDRGAKSYHDLSFKSKNFIEEIDQYAPVVMAFSGPKQDEAFVRNMEEGWVWE